MRYPLMKERRGQLSPRFFARLGKSNRAPCSIRVMWAAASSDTYIPRPRSPLRRSSFACSSDQKNTERRQKASVMHLSGSAEKSTSGTNVIGPAPASAALARAWLSISRWIGSAQWAHSVVTLTERGSPISCPCTKGTANASIPQAE